MSKGDKASNQHLYECIVKLRDAAAREVEEVPGKERTSSTTAYSDVVPDNSDHSAASSSHQQEVDQQLHLEFSQKLVIKSSPDDEDFYPAPFAPPERTAGASSTLNKTSNKSTGMIVLAGDVGGTNTRLQLTEHLDSPFKSKSTSVGAAQIQGLLSQSPRSVSEFSSHSLAASSHLKYQSNYRNSVRVLFDRRYKAADYMGLEEIIIKFLAEAKQHFQTNASASPMTAGAGASASGTTGGATTTSMAAAAAKSTNPRETTNSNSPKRTGSNSKIASSTAPPAINVSACCIAVAGPVVNGEVEFTNLPWNVREDELAECLSLEPTRVRLINDFVANGYGIETLEIRAEKTSSSPPTVEKVLRDKPDVLCLQEPLNDHSLESTANSPIATIGAGTGLGYGIVVRDPVSGTTTNVYPSEGGHMDFAPVDDEQLGLFAFLKKKLHRVSAERVCCGPGIVNIYKYVRENPLYNTPEDPCLKREMCKVREIDQPALIFEYAKKGDPMCLRTLDIFIKVYGTIAGNWALATVPKQGLFILGGIGPKMAKELSDGRFIDKFRDKGRMTGVVRDVPVYLVLNGDVGLQGASVYAARLVPPSPGGTGTPTASRPTSGQLQYSGAVYLGAAASADQI
ncbi:unnamed protein product [Amoebophrya sp. A120]|nr:unnamed protein product [Amoebophrya sp. A120]|eukprot:GSA120T00009620001.1